LLAGLIAPRALDKIDGMDDIWVLKTIVLRRDLWRKRRARTTKR